MVGEHTRLRPPSLRTQALRQGMVVPLSIQRDDFSVTLEQISDNAGKLLVEMEMGHARLDALADVIRELKISLDRLTEVSA